MRNLCQGTHAFPRCAALFRFPHLSFLPPVPYPPLRGTFPIEKGGPRQRRSGTFVNCLLETISPALFHPAFPIQPPPLRGTSFPWKGLPSAARRGWLPFLRRSGTFVNGALEMIFPALFHPASALSAPTGHLPLEGKALSVVILFSHMRVFPLMLWGGKRYSHIVAFPTRGRLTIRGKPAVKRPSGIAPYIFAAKPPPQP